MAKVNMKFKTAVFYEGKKREIGEVMAVEKKEFERLEKKGRFVEAGGTATAKAKPEGVE